MQTVGGTQEAGGGANPQAAFASFAEAIGSRGPNLKGAGAPPPFSSLTSKFNSKEKDPSTLPLPGDAYRSSLTGRPFQANAPGGGGALASPNYPSIPVSAYSSAPTSPHKGDGRAGAPPAGGGAPSSVAAASGGGAGGASPPSDAPYGSSEDFENMVGDLRRSFIGWLKRTEQDLRGAKEGLLRDRASLEEETAKFLRQMAEDRRAEFEKIEAERRRQEAEVAEILQQLEADRQESRRRTAEERERLEGEKEQYRRRMLTDREKFRQEFEAFERERRRVVDPQMAAEGTVDLNVGGVVFETSRETLVQQGGSFLASLLSGRHLVSRDRQGRVFLDRDPEAFRLVLNFLRNPKSPPVPGSSEESEVIVREAEWLGVRFFPFPLVFACGGHSGNEPLRAMEVLDVGQQCWRPCGAMKTERSAFGSASLRGALHVFGGFNDDYRALYEGETYDALRDEWIAAPSLQVPRRNCGSAVLEEGPDNRIFAVGGFDGHAISASVEARDFRIRKWMDVPPLPSPRSAAVCAPFGAGLLVSGGTDGKRLRSAERFDARANKWETLTEGMAEIRSAACGAVCVSHVFVAGGTDDTQDVKNTVEALDPDSLKWTPRQPMLNERMDAAMCCVSDSLLVGGGTRGSVLASTEFFRPELDQWQEGPPMLFPRYGHSLLTMNL
uniref:Potassium channel tetramerisation-type BTB domain-containing protein n=1 Tax=Chromera velia CCMP2878 TaxID=1169474 RepID=A0A0G4HRY7_9ALVE|eukprot:Cvel_30817.t1-p1 / transcript=Cvel_30817.t1 / gene=Cvel_30817 / organism=Chromera_velia_CCMP2878 / gene_product=Kelch-like protein 3, putative / transcript_product=Kelch-like protein 3, putative / location=Cvel_scaffold4471:1945-8649(-) / protein_length=667 / sequence_SO=supercontig / SO=protein_coding / is_pseudo=false